jgi:hypothetical protein
MPLRPGVLGPALTGLGLAMAAVALLADVIGLGRNPKIIGQYQFILLCVGAIVFMLGFAITIAVWPGDRGK